MKRNVFISYSQEDSNVALELAGELEKAGYSTWYYERDGVPGVPYLLLTGRAIEDCDAVLLLVSRASLSSHQVTREVERAHEAGRILFPVLLDISHQELQARQASWRQAIGTHSSIRMPPEGAGTLIPWIIKGLEMMGVAPSGEAVVIETPSAKPWRRTGTRSGMLELPGGRVAAEGERSFIYGFKPPTRGIYGRGNIVKECVRLAIDRSRKFLCLYGPGGIGKSTIAALTFSRILEEECEGFDSHIWYDLRSGPGPETALLLLVNIATEGEVP